MGYWTGWTRCCSSFPPPTSWCGSCTSVERDEAPVTEVDRPIEVSLVGSTGSIGTQALDVVASEPERFRVVALAA
ncbi:MAG TPA: hypothetical protein VK428_14790, partial [Acidimicrobiales bacterium]|nr:hypothetical protein [Acidimicrobiales bacterium]